MLPGPLVDTELEDVGTVLVPTTSSACCLTHAGEIEVAVTIVSSRGPRPRRSRRGRNCGPGCLLACGWTKSSRRPSPPAVEPRRKGTGCRLAPITQTVSTDLERVVPAREAMKPGRRPQATRRRGSARLRVHREASRGIRAPSRSAAEPADGVERRGGRSRLLAPADPLCVVGMILR